MMIRKLGEVSSDFVVLGKSCEKYSNCGNENQIENTCTWTIYNGLRVCPTMRHF